MEGDSDATLPNSFPVPEPETLLSMTSLDISDEIFLQKSESPPRADEGDLRVQNANALGDERLMHGCASALHGGDQVSSIEGNTLHKLIDHKKTSCNEFMSHYDGDTKIGSEIGSQITTSSYVPKASLQSTPLSSLPPGSLMRHLLALRKQQYLLSRDLPSDIREEPSLILTQGKNSGHIALSASTPKFTTSTPQIEFNSLQDYKNKHEVTRRPLSELPLSACSNSENINPPAEIAHNHNSSPAASSPSENSRISLADVHVCRLYNPNFYRSPPKSSSGDDKFCVPDLLPSADPNAKNDIAASIKATRKVPVPHLGTKFTTSPKDDDRPLSASNKSFEEILTEKLEDESYCPSSSARSGPSKKFLKKGSGKSRFTSAISSLPDGRKPSRKDTPSANDSLIHAKPKFPYLKKGTGNRRYKIKSVKLKKVAALRKSVPTADSIVQEEASFQVSDSRYGETNQSPGMNMDNGLDFMSPIQRVCFQRESEELKAFEALEELAEHSSFCSDASTVNNLLRRGLEYSMSSTPAGSPSTRIRRYPIVREMEARRLGGCTDSPHPQRGSLGHAVALKENSESDNGSKGEGLRAKKSVQFCKQGAQVLEYHADDDPLTEAQLSLDASDMFSVSDLEILNQMNCKGKIPVALSVESVACSENRCLNTLKTPTDVRNDRTAHHQILQFSPPRFPHDAASYAVWEAFGKKAKKVSAHRTRSVPESSPKFPESKRSIEGAEAQKCSDELSVTVNRRKEEELEAHKILLVSKVHELEREIKTFQNENAVLVKLRQTLAREKELFDREKLLFDEILTRERRNMEEQFEVERNRLWREKCSLRSNKEAKPQNDNVLEIIDLKEEILILKNQLERQDSMNNFTVNKLKNKVKELMSEKKDLESKLEKISALEKENLSLKHQIDRLKLTSRAVCDKSSVKAMAVCRANSVPVSNTMQSQTHYKSIPKARCGETLKHKSVSFAENFLSPENTASETILVNESAGTKKPLSLAESYLVNFSSSVSESATPVSSADCSASALKNSEENLSDGTKIITYANGNKKQIFPSGCVIHEYYNGDRKETYRDRVVYFYSFNGTRQTTYLDGSEELHFPNGQTEIKRADTSVEVIFPDHSKTVKLPDGTEVHYNSDGTVVTSTPSGEKVIKFPSGQQEVHGLGFKRREYPDGTSKVLYDDGSSETIYPNGRIRVKDQDGNIVSDTKLGLELI